MKAEFLSRKHVFLIRTSIGTFALFCLIWVCFAAPTFWRQSTLEVVAKRIAAEEPFNSESLTSLALRWENPREQNARKSILNKIAIIELRLLENALSRADLGSIDRRTSELRSLVRLSLSNSPSDAFLWITLFWLENSYRGFHQENLKYLQMSYATGANEGWVAIKRNRFSLSLYSVLTKELASDAVTEFSRLVESGFFESAAAILEGPGWAVRDKLMSSISAVEQIQRQQFAKMIYRRGLDLTVPGVDRVEWRPWH